jgi:hypothetical protein
VVDVIDSPVVMRFGGGKVLDGETLGVKYSIRWGYPAVLHGRREGLRGRLGLWCVWRKAIWSLRLRLHSGLRQRGKGLRPGFVPGASPQAGIGRAFGPLLAFVG